MIREEGLKLLNQNIKNQNLIKHMLATEAVMKALYLKLNQDPNTEGIEDWGIVGLLHDLDYELCKDHPKKHALVTPAFVLNRFKEKSFARGANREQIKMCEEKLNIPLSEFVTIGL